MDEQLYVRVRGRVQGPFSLDKLRALVKRGQLSRMHEVSPDGTLWKSASEYSEIFASERVQNTPQDTQAKRQPSTDSSGDLELEAPESPQWYYSQNNAQLGPVSFRELQHKASIGTLTARDLVWRQGTQDWVPAGTVPGLGFDGVVRRETKQDGAEASSQITGDLVRTVRESQAWVRFLRSCVFVLGGLLLGLGLLAVIFGARLGEPFTLGSGFLLWLYAGVAIYWSVLLHAYSSTMGKFIDDGSSFLLDSALRKLQKFWVYNSIILIVIIVNMTVASVWLVAIGFAFPFM